MPFKSESQRRKFYQLKKEGKMSQSTIDEWESKTPKSLPKKVKNKTKCKSKRCKK
jgi:hypothetical protein